MEPVDTLCVMYRGVEVPSELAEVYQIDSNAVKAFMVGVDYGYASGWDDAQDEEAR